MTPSEDQIELLTHRFSAIFLNFDGLPPEGLPPEGGRLAEGGDGDPTRLPIGRHSAGRHSPGPVPAAEGSLGLRHMTDPTARVLAGLYFIRPLMQAFSVRNADERDAFNRALIRISGVEPLLQDGRLVRAVVTWSGGRWPKRLTGIRVSLPGGEAERRRLLGRFEPHLRQMAAALLTPDDQQFVQHYVGRTQVGLPRR